MKKKQRSHKEKSFPSKTNSSLYISGPFFSTTMDPKIFGTNFGKNNVGLVGLLKLFNLDIAFISSWTGKGTKHRKNTLVVGDENFGFKIRTDKRPLVGFKKKKDQVWWEF